MGFIYMLTFPSEKSYIGQTIRDIHERLQEHQYASSSSCVAVSRAIQKYGWENVKKEWYEVPDEDLNFYEEMLVALLGTLSPGGYNLREGGGATGKPSEETKQKISKAMSGEKHPMYGKTPSDETKQKISKAKSGEKHHMFGKTRTEETKRKMSEAMTGEKNPMYGKTGEKNPMYGKTHTEETKQKMSEAKTGEKHHASKKVYQYTLDGTYVDSYGSFGEAARAIGKTDGSYIGLCAGGKRKKAYGFKWSREKL
ncbi:GIY-YIG catalytic domain-containing endonuclease [Paramecium bursaria Chlorella virus OR0704.2.2]|nr:GIY-YIG catalytic domain-containing endonuclease [Paramecium bursaria Chlorella virus OR0704.2.2]